LNGGIVKLLNKELTNCNKVEMMRISLNTTHLCLKAMCQFLAEIKDVVNWWGSGLGMWLKFVQVAQPPLGSSLYKTFKNSKTCFSSLIFRI
jgi:hypothetical protein